MMHLLSLAAAEGDLVDLNNHVRMVIWEKVHPSSSDMAASDTLNIKMLRVWNRLISLLIQNLGLDIFIRQLGI